MRLAIPLTLTLLIAGPTPGPAAHPLHVSYGAMTIDDQAANLRIRLFTDDLERALAGSSRRGAVTMGATPGLDSVFAEYLAHRFTVEADHHPIRPEVVASGAEGNLWWYQIRYPLPRRTAVIGLANRVLFEVYDDQQNLLKVRVATTGRETSFYFVPSEPGPVTVRLR